MIKEIPILGDEWCVAVCFGDEKEVAKAYKKYGHKPTNNTGNFNDYNGHTAITFGETPLISMPRKPKRTDELGTLAHEAVHAVNNIFDQIKADYNDEIFATCVGIVVKRALED